MKAQKLPMVLQAASGRETQQAGFSVCACVASILWLLLCKCFWSLPLWMPLSSRPTILQVNLHSNIFVVISELVSLFAIKTPD